MATVSTSAPLDLTDLCLGWSKSAGLHIDIAPSGFALPVLTIHGESTSPYISMEDFAFQVVAERR